jgi:hypothetical protein
MSARKTAAVLAAMVLLMPVTSHAVMLAPPQWDGKKFSGTLRIIYDSPLAIRFKCGLLASACADLEGKICTIRVPYSDGSPASVRTVRLLIRHETAHCVGWPAHHPGARDIS